MSSQVSTKKVEDFNIPRGNILKKIAYILAFVGPASMICSTSMGPGTASSCVQAGALFGYSLLWVIVLSGIMCGGVAYIGAKITALSGMNVFDFIKSKIGSIGANVLVSVVLGTWFMVIYSQGATMKHLNDILFGETFFSPFMFVITIAAIAYLYTCSTNNRIIKIASVMCTLMAAIYFINVFYVHPVPANLFKGMIPKLPTAAQAAIIAGVIGGSAPGTSALWYSYSVKNQHWDTPGSLKFIKWDQIIFASLFTIFSLGIFLSGAAVLFPAGIKVVSAVDAARAIEPLTGQFGKYVFVLGLWGAVFTTIGGMSTLASYAVNSLFQISPDNSDPKVRKFILIGIVISLLAGIIKVNAMALLVNFIGLLNIGGFVIICILTYYSGNKKFAGEYVNKWYTTLIGVVIIAFNLYAVWSYITRFIK